jgi:IS5 family transposase
MIPRVQQAMKQARARVLGGNTRADNKILSMFEPDTEVIRKGKASKPTEFGKMVKIQEAENQIVIHCEVFDQRPSDSDLLTPSIEKHKELLDRFRIWWLPTRDSSPPPTKPPPNNWA